MKLYTTEEVAEMLQMHNESIRRKCRLDELPCLKIGREWRIREDDLNQWLEKQKA